MALVALHIRIDEDLDRALRKAAGADRGERTRIVVEALQDRLGFGAGPSTSDRLEGLEALTTALRDELQGKGEILKTAIGKVLAADIETILAIADAERSRRGA